MFEFLSKMGNNELGLDCISLIFNRPVHEYCTCLDGVLLAFYLSLCLLYIRHTGQNSLTPPHPLATPLSLSLSVCAIKISFMRICHQDHGNDSQRSSFSYSYPLPCFTSFENYHITHNRSRSSYQMEEQLNFFSSQFIMVPHQHWEPLQLDRYCLSQHRKHLCDKSLRDTAGGNACPV